MREHMKARALVGWAILPVLAAIGLAPIAAAAEPAATSGKESAAGVEFPQGFIEEGPLPEGFPPPSEVGQVVEKSYPLSRTYSAEGDNAFMRCFAYLAKNQHEMTVPVILDYRRRGADAAPAADDNLQGMAVDRMHFILEKPSLDEPKQDGPVTVADMSKLRVLSIAYQGRMTDEALAEAESKLKDALKQRKDLIAAGEKRVLGYNSPMVPRNKQFWEVQIPVQAADAKE